MMKTFGTFGRSSVLNVSGAGSTTECFMNDSPPPLSCLVNLLSFLLPVVARYFDLSRDLSTYLRASQPKVS